MMELALGAALVAGLAGSGHCLAMCGGMASLLSARRTQGKPLPRTLTYNLGRLTSYTLAGALAGLLGQGVGLAAGVGAVPLRVVSGVIIILAGLYLLTGRRFFAPFERIGEHVWRKVSPVAVRQLRKDGHRAVFTLGMLWGWLPCGMTWSMLAIAAASGSALQGAGIMAAFGLGTLPALLTAGLAGLTLRNLLNRAAWRNAAAVCMLAAGAWTAVFPLLANHGETTTTTTTHAHHAH